MLSGFAQLYKVLKKLILSGFAQLYKVLKKLILFGFAPLYKVLQSPSFVAKDMNASSSTIRRKTFKKGNVLVILIEMCQCHCGENNNETLIISVKLKDKGPFCTTVSA